MRKPYPSRAAGLSAAVLVVLSSIALWFGGADRAVQAQSDSRYGDVPMDLGAFAVELTLGLNDTEPTDWSGGFRLPARRVLAIEGAESAGGTDWQAESAPIRTRAARKKDATSLIRPARLTATLSVGANSSVEVATNQGRFAFRPGDLSLSRDRIFLGGRAAARRLPLTAALSDSPTDDDYPAATVASDGSIWCAYVSYTTGPLVDSEATSRGEFDSLVAKGNGDQIRLMRFAGGKWEAAIKVTAPGLDVWRPAVAVAPNGEVWVVWSQNNGGNWDLYARTYTPAERIFGETRRLTTGKGADINVVAAGNGASGVWIAWQAWRDGNFDILTAKLGATIEPQRVSITRTNGSNANDWNPAIAAGTDGTVWVAWDTYDQGNYDVYARSFEDGKRSEPIAVAASPRFEARASVAVDRANRLWVAFEDAGPNWGKDYGDRWPGKQGVAFYIERYIKLRCIDKGKVYETRGELRSDLGESYHDDPKKPMELRHRISIPRVVIDEADRVWVFYRRHPLRSGLGERWAGYANYYAGGDWAGEVALPYSDNVLDNRPALVGAGQQGILAIYSTDSRTFSVRDARNNQLRAAWLSAGDKPQTAALRAVVPELPSTNRDTPIHPDESQQVSRIRSYRAEVGGESLHYLRGEFHRHTEISSHRDWDGPFEELWRYGLDVAAMDWIGPGDHDYGVGRDYLWWLTQKQVDIYHHPGAFVPMFTYERSNGYPSGHRNVMFAQRGIRPLPRLEGRNRLFGTPEGGSDDIRNLYSFLKRFHGICSSHTSATNMGTDWRDYDPEVEPVVEIFQGHRQSYEETNAPLAASGPEETIQGYRPLGFVWNAFAKGRRLGFQASSDHVSTHLSYGIVITADATREGIIAAFKKRHSYAAHDNIILDVRSGGHMMGDEFTVDTLPRLDIKVIGTTPIAKIEIVRQEAGRMPLYAAAFQPDQAEASLSWTDRAARPGEVTMYYVRVRQHDHKMAWASPMWVHYKPNGE